MWFPLVPTAVLATGVLLAAQGIRLDRKVERPLLYVAQRAPVSGGEDVLASLHDEVLLGALGLGETGSRNVKEVDTGGAVLRSVQRLLSRLSRYSDAAEMALVGTVPLRGNRSRPLLVFHTQLRADGIADMRGLLDSGELAVRSRKLHDRQVFRFKSDSRTEESSGEVVEIALVDRDLVVSNDRRTMGRLLDPRTTAGGGLAASPRFTRLRAQVDVPPGSLLVYADWRALQPRLDRFFGGDAAWLMSLSGIELPEQLMFVARPAPRKHGQKRGIVTSVLLQHASGSRRNDGETRPKDRPDGWLDLLKDARPRDLLTGLPHGGFVTIAGMLDFEKILPTHRSKRVRVLQASIFYRCRRLGIDLRRQILRRLSATGGAQLLILTGDANQSGGMRLAWSMRAKSTRDARELFKVFQKMFVPSKDATLHGSKELRFGGGAMVLALVHDSLVLAFSPSVIAKVREMTASARKTPSSRRASTALLSRLQRLGVKSQHKVAGVIGLDLGFLADRIRPEQTGDAKASGRTRSKDRFSGFLGLHGGYFRFEKDLVRLEVFTELDDP